MDIPLFASNLHKFQDGGWFPIVVAIGVVAVMHTWKRGKEEIFKRIYANEVTEDELSNLRPLAMRSRRPANPALQSDSRAIDGALRALLFDAAATERKR